MNNYCQTQVVDYQEPMTSLEEIKNNINRYFKKLGHDAHYAGAESMINYIEQRDKEIDRLTHNLMQSENMAMHLREEISKLKKQNDDASTNMRKYRNDLLNAQVKINEFHALLTQVINTPGVSKNLSKGQRQSIKQVLDNGSNL